MAWDKSELPLFPKIKSTDKVEWPANKRFFLIKDWIRQNNYREVGAYRYYYQNEVLQSAIVYESPDEMIRMQLLIVPDVSGVILDQVSFFSEDEKGNRLLTDNVFMPFGGVYPENWTINRYPSIRKIERLAKKHINELSKSNFVCAAIKENVLDWTEQSQSLLEETNIKCGFLNEKSNRQEFGKMTGEGRYRIWKELLMLHYFCNI